MIHSTQVGSVDQGLKRYRNVSISRFSLGHVMVLTAEVGKGQKLVVDRRQLVSLYEVRQ